ncbi:MAG: ATP-binding cassette domain-containing protein [Solirubrobacterales bacterium]
MSSLTVDLSLCRGRFSLDVAFSIDATAALTGPSGAGKTTLLRVLAGLDQCGDGYVSVGEDVWIGAGRPTPAELRSVGCLAQEGGLFPHMTAAGNVAYPLIADRVGRRRRRAVAVALLAEIGLADVADVPVTRLSGGQRRRVALARALAGERAVYLLDEPFAGLDARTADRVEAFIGERLRRAASPALIAGHDLGRLSTLAERTLRLTGGRLVESVPDEAWAISGSADRARVREPAATPQNTVRRLADYRAGSQ